MNNDELVEKLAAMLHDGGKCCGGCNPCVDPLAGMQYGHSSARFNDTSSQTVLAQQQAFVAQQGAQFAHLLSLTTDLTNGRPKQ